MGDIVRKGLLYKIFIIFLMLMLFCTNQVFASKEDLEKDKYVDENDRCKVNISTAEEIFYGLDTDGDKELSIAELEEASDEEIGTLFYFGDYGNTASNPLFHSRYTSSEAAIETEFNSRREEYGLPIEEDRATGDTGYDEFYSPGKVGDAGTTGSNLDDTITAAEDFIDSADDTANVSESALQDFSNTFYGIFLAVATVVTVIVGIIIGIKYMMSSAGEKANVKQMLLPYVVGCVVVYGSFGIWALVVSLLSSI